MPAPNVRSIRARARRLLADSVGYAKSYPSRIRGWKNWTRGVVIAERLDGTVYVTSYYDIGADRKRDIVRAVACLRDAGWTVDDDGTIRDTPAKEPE